MARLLVAAAMACGACAGESEPQLETTSSGNQGEGDDGASSARALAFGTDQSSESVTVQAASDSYFAVDVLATRTYTLELTTTGPCPANSLFSEVSLRSADADPSALLDRESMDYLNESKKAREFVPGADGQAIVHVEGSCPYAIAVHRSTDDGLQHDADLEPNDSPSTAPILAFAETQSTEAHPGLVSTPIDPDDYYAVDGVQAAHTYTLELTATGPCSANSLFSDVTLVGAASATPSSLLDSESMDYLNESKKTREFVPSADGRAIVHVRGSCPYEVAVHRSTDDGLQHDAELEPNNSPSTAPILAFVATQSTETRAGLVTTALDSDDYYAIDGVEANRTYTLELTATGPCPANSLFAEATLSRAVGGAPSSLLQGESMDYLNESKKTREFVPSADGRAIVHVSGRCPYEMTVRRSTDDGLQHDADLEPNDSPSTAATLMLDQLVTSAVALHSDDDYLALPVEAGEYVLEFSAIGTCPAQALRSEAQFSALGGGNSELLGSRIMDQINDSTLLRPFTAPGAGRAVIRVSGDCAYSVRVSSGT